jgi:hypothetical protein
MGCVSSRSGGTETPMTEPRLPFSLESEKAILGAILLEPKQLFTVLCFAAVEDFALSSHREILRTIILLDSRGIAADLVTLVTELDQSRKLESVGARVTWRDWSMGCPIDRIRKPMRLEFMTWRRQERFTLLRRVPVPRSSRESLSMMCLEGCSKKNWN